MALVVNAGALAAAFFRGAIYPDDLKTLFEQILAVYSIPVGTILGGIFAEPGGGRESVPKPAFWVALVLALLWNFVLVIRCVVFAFAHEDLVSDFVGFLTAVSSASLFLVSGALAYFFTKKSTPGDHAL